MENRRGKPDSGSGLDGLVEMFHRACAAGDNNFGIGGGANLANQRQIRTSPNAVGGFAS